MKRLTVDKSAREMTGIELAHNCMYSYDGWARYRSFDKDEDLFDFIREFAKAENEGLPTDNKEVAEMLLDGLQYGIDNPFGRVALVYNLMWAMADLRETLKAYEDTGLAPEEILSKEKNASWNGWTKGAYIGLDDYGDPKYSDRRYYRCSNCHYGSVVQSPYCPQCGRKMGKENC